MQKFEITLKNEKVKLYNQLSWLIIFINITVFIYLAFFSADKGIRASSITTLILLTVCFLLKYYFRNTKYKFSSRPFFLFLMLGWIGVENYWLAGVVAILDILSVSSTSKKVVRFTSDYFDYPSFLHRTIYWDKVTNVLLKDGLLTIDLKNNKLIQQLIDENETAIDEKEFNDFCKEQLKAASSN